MWFSRKQMAPPAAAEVAGPGQGRAEPVRPQPTTKSRGDAAEAAARRFLTRAGLTFIEANFKTPGRGGGEIDLVMRAPDGTLVFVEVRQRASATHGGAAASIGRIKQQRIIFAARHFLMRFARTPPCRFDVVLVQGAGVAGREATLEWLPAAFDAS